MAPDSRDKDGSPSPQPPQLLDGIRVLDVGHIVAGPFAASVLGDFGAEVISVERPIGGDPFRTAYTHRGVGLFHKVGGRNKLAITLDLKHPRGREIFHELVAKSDVLVENYRPGVMERLGNDWDTLKAIQPGLIFCRVSGWGQTGPYSGQRSYGRVAEAFAGFAHLNGDRDGPPMHSAMSLGDTVAGVWGAVGILMALYWRDARDGTGQVIDVALYEPLFRQIEQQIIVMDQMGTTLRRIGNENPGNPFVGLYETRDGEHFSISAATPASVRDCLRVVGLDADERFSDWSTRSLAHRDELQRHVAHWIASRTIAEVETAFRKNGAAGSRVMDASRLIHDPHVRAREAIITVDDDELGPVLMPGVVPRFSDTPGRVRHGGQRMGASNERIYSGLLGMDSDELEELSRLEII